MRGGGGAVRDQGCSQANDAAAMTISAIPSRASADLRAPTGRCYGAMVRDATAEDAEAIASVHAAAWRDTYVGMLPEALIANFGYERVLPRWRERLPATPPQSILVWSEPVAGYAYSGPSRDGDPAHAGEVYAIYLTAERRGQGGGRALLAASAARLAAAGLASMVVWVLRDNHPARAFYERLGGRYVGARPLLWAGAEAAVEVAYGWADTAELRAPAPG